MSFTFGDFEDADAVSTEPPDPEALARLFYVIRHRIAPDKKRAATFDAEPELVRVLMVYVFAEIIGKLIREWQKEPL